jgi:hypothetical protein
MDSNSIAAYTSLVISLGAVILAVINHKRIRSNCCGKEASVSLDIENTSPKKEAFVECPTSSPQLKEDGKLKKISQADPSISASPP